MSGLVNSGRHTLKDTFVAEVSCHHEAHGGFIRAGFRSATGNDETHFSWGDDVTPLELADVACNTSTMSCLRSARARARSGEFLVSVTSEGFITDAFEWPAVALTWTSDGDLHKARHEHDDACHL